MASIQSVSVGDSVSVEFDVRDGSQTDTIIGEVTEVKTSDSGLPERIVVDGERVGVYEITHGVIFAKGSTEPFGWDPDIVSLE